MKKSFTVKVYWINGAFKKTLSWKEVIDCFEFSSQINGGQGEWTLVLNKEFGDTEISTGDIVKVYVYTDNNPSGVILYSGYISRLARKYTPQKNVIEYKMIWLSSILNFVYFYAAWYSFNKNQDPAQTIKDVIDYFNTQYSAWFFSYSGGNIQNYWSNISLDFAYKNCRDSIVLASSATNYWWRIGADWQVWFKPIPWTATHRFTAWKDVSEIEVQESSEEIKNRYILNWKSWTLAPVNDATSQSAYWIRELYESKTDLADSWSATIYANNFLASNKDIKKITSISVNNSYNIENIFPWDTLKVLNLDYTVDNLQIKKVTYTPEKVKLDVEVLESLWQTIFNP